MLENFYQISVIISFLMLIVARRNLFSVGMIWLLLFSIYYYFPLLNKNALRQHVLFKPAYYEEAVFYCFVFLLSWFVGYCFGLYQKSSRRIIVDIIAPKSLNLLGITSLGLIVLGYFIVGGYNNIGSYGNVSYSDSYASTFIQFHMIASVFLTVILVSDADHRILILIAALVCVSIFAIGVRSTAVSISLPIIYKLFLRSRLINQFLIIVLGFFVLIFVQVMRAFTRIGFSDAFERFQFMLSEGALKVLLIQSQAFAILTNVLEYYATNGPIFGASFVEGLKLIIPGPIRRATGLPDCFQFCPSSWFMDYSDSRWRIGGWAFSIVAELVLNFGIFLVIFVFMIGYLMSRIDNSLCDLKKRNDFYAIYGVILIGASFTFFRNDFALTFKKVIYQTIILFGVLSVTTKIYRKRDVNENTSTIIYYLISRIRLKYYETMNPKSPWLVENAIKFMDAYLKPKDKILELVLEEVPPGFWKKDV